MDRDHSTDRRVLRTRTTLLDALVTLILRKSYREITIKDIVDEANVGRSTFYAHFTSKDNLLKKGMDGLRSQLLNYQKEVPANQSKDDHHELGFSLFMLEHVGDHLNIYRALAGEQGGTIARNSIEQIFSDLVRGNLAPVFHENSDEQMSREFVVQHIVGSFMAILVWWLNSGAKLSPAKIDGMYRQLVERGINRTSSSVSEIS